MVGISPAANSFLCCCKTCKGWAGALMLCVGSLEGRRCSRKELLVWLSGFFWRREPQEFAETQGVTFVLCLISEPCKSQNAGGWKSPQGHGGTSSPSLSPCRDGDSSHHLDREQGQKWGMCPNDWSLHIAVSSVTMNSFRDSRREELGGVILLGRTGLGSSWLFSSSNHHQTYLHKINNIEFCIFIAFFFY